MHPKSGVCIGGDLNNLGMQKLLDCFPDTIDLVTKPTFGMPILDVLVTNIHRGYDQAVISPLIQSVVPGQGVASDHFVAFRNKDMSRMTGFSRKETRQ